MNLLTTQYVHHLQRLEIYLAGCKGVNGVHCKGCHNPQSWDFNAGVPITGTTLNMLKAKTQQDLVKNIWILGGEPLDNDYRSLIDLLVNLKRADKPIWLFTRRELEEVPEGIKTFLTYIKTGAYIEDLPTKEISGLGLTLGSNNQNIYQKYVDNWLKV